MQKWNHLFTFFALSPGILAFQSCVNEEDKKLNVLFIAVDDLRATLGCYGDPLVVSPNIDRLAEQGVVFTRAYVQQAVCNPSRVSMLTGLRPDQTGVVDLRSHFRDKMPELVTLPQLFKQNNYETVGLGKIYHGHERAQDDLSWTIPPMYNVIPKMDQYALSVNRVNGKAAATEYVEGHDSIYADGKITEEAIRLIRRFKKSEVPFFMALGYHKPHLPFAAPKKYWDLYNRDDFAGIIQNKQRPVNAPDIAFHNWQELRGYRDIPVDGPLTVETEKLLWHGYYACVSYIDAQVGRIMATLEELKLLENTIIVFWSDHGFHLGEQDTWCKSTNFELDIHTPTIISAPGISKPGGRCHAIVESVDLYPTIIDLCGINYEGELAGVSKKQLLIDPGKKWDRPAYHQFARPYRAVGNVDNATHMGYSVRTDKWRFTAWYNLENDSVEFQELYSLAGSNIETENLSGQEEFAEIEIKHIRLVENYKRGIY